MHNNIKMALQCEIEYNLGAMSILAKFAGVQTRMQFFHIEWETVVSSLFTSFSEHSLTQFSTLSHHVLLFYIKKLYIMCEQRV